MRRTWYQVADSAILTPSLLAVSSSHISASPAGQLFLLRPAASRVPTGALCPCRQLHHQRRGDWMLVPVEMSVRRPLRVAWLVRTQLGPTSAHQLQAGPPGQSAEGESGGSPFAYGQGRGAALPGKKPKACLFLQQRTRIKLQALCPCLLNTYVFKIYFY